MMNLKSKQQYMNTLGPQYLQASKKDKGKFLDEYCRNTGQNRKHVIKKFRSLLKPPKGKVRARRPEYYTRDVRAALVQIWQIFDRPCGQRLEPLLKTETDRLIRLGELDCSKEVVAKLKTITPSTIDKKLAHEKEVLRLRQKYRAKNTFPLGSKVPTKSAAELDKEQPGTEQIDCVEHCGVSASGEYILSLSIVDIYSGWWEADAVMGKGQQKALMAIKEAATRCPFAWVEIHPDNGGNIFNYHVYAFAQKNGIALSHSRPYRKNDNCFIEQKQSTHIRKPFGYLRYDTEEERKIISDLLRNEMRLYKNFFQPVLKLTAKTRIKGKVKKKFDRPKTPYQRLLESKALSNEKKQELTALYCSLNPAELKRRINTKLKQLSKAHDQKKTGLQVEASRSRLQKISVS